MLVKWFLKRQINSFLNNQEYFVNCFSEITLYINIVLFDLKI